MLYFYMARSDTTPVSVVNLVEDNVYVLTKEERFLLLISKYARYLVMLVEAVVVIIFAVHAMYDYSLIKLRREIKGLIRVLEASRQDEARIVHLASFLNDLETIDAQRFSMYELNQRFLSLMGTGVTLENVNFIGKSVSVTGVADSYRVLTALETRLKDSEDIDQNTLRISLQERKDGRVSFELSFEFR